MTGAREYAVPVAGDVAAAIAEAFPLEWAEPWDRVGLLAGDPDACCEGVLVTLDVTVDAVARALELGATVIASHHPAFLEPPARLTPAEAGPLVRALAAGISLIAAHTNLDRAPAGADALPSLFGLAPGAPLEDTAMPMTSLTVYVPRDARARVERAMMSAGAGRIGNYDGCSFSVDGTGSFTPRSGARPAIGAIGAPSHAEEVRLETVCPGPLAPSVIAAIRNAHPYEEPLVVATSAHVARGHARLGRVCELDEPQTLAEFAHDAERRTGGAVRVRGARDARIARVAFASGSAGALAGAALNAGADVLVAGEVRYHDAVAAGEAGLATIELGHDASEWPLVPVLAEAVRTTPGLDPALVFIDRPTQGYWTP